MAFRIYIEDQYLTWEIEPLPYTGPNEITALSRAGQSWTIAHALHSPSGDFPVSILEGRAEAIAHYLFDPPERDAF